MAQIKGILFDKDGTLVDFQKTWFAIGDRLAMEAAAGDRVRADQLMDEAGYDFANHCFRADSVFAAGTNADIVALWYPHVPDVLRRNMVAHFDSITASEGAAKAVPVPGALPVIHLLHERGYRLGVATNDSTAGASQTILMLGIAPMFAAAFGYDSVRNPKPAPDAIHAFCAVTGLTPEEIAMVGDNQHDMVMARAGGVGLAVGVLSGTGTQATLGEIADVVLDSIVDLPACLAARDGLPQPGEA